MFPIVVSILDKCKTTVGPTRPGSPLMKLWVPGDVGNDPLVLLHVEMIADILGAH